ncbi:hypothetical protein MTP99_008566 [Tenebrio molitor]|nr:hypothetical protein MTP99_008566 [Tenebrio molitor]
MNTSELRILGRTTFVAVLGIPAWCERNRKLEIFGERRLFGKVTCPNWSCDLTRRTVDHHGVGVMFMRVSGPDSRSRSGGTDEKPPPNADKATPC